MVFAAVVSFVVVVGVGLLGNKKRLANQSRFRGFEG